MRANEFIIEGYKEATSEFTKLTNDQQTVMQSINQFKDLVNRNQVTGPERNIDFWRKQGWEKFEKFVTSKSTQPSKTQVKRSRVSGSFITVKEPTDQNPWWIVIPYEKSASVWFAKSSNWVRQTPNVKPKMQICAWCTTKPYQNHFEDYFFNRKIILTYALNVITGDMAALAGHHSTNQIEISDAQDNAKNAPWFHQFTGIDPDELMSDIKAKYGSGLDQYREKYKKVMDELNDMHGDTHKARDPQIEEKLIYAKNGDACARYILLTRNEHGTNQNTYPEEIQLAAFNFSSTEQATRGINLNGGFSYRRSALLAEIVSSIQNQSPRLQWEAISSDDGIDLIRGLNNPSEKVQNKIYLDFVRIPNVIRGESPAYLKATFNISDAKMQSYSYLIDLLNTTKSVLTSIDPNFEKLLLSNKSQNEYRYEETLKSINPEVLKNALDNMNPIIRDKVVSAHPDLIRFLSVVSDNQIGYLVNSILTGEPWRAWKLLNVAEKYGNTHTDAIIQGMKSTAESFDDQELTETVSGFTTGGRIEMPEWMQNTFVEIANEDTDITDLLAMIVKNPSANLLDNCSGWSIANCKEEKLNALLTRIKERVELDLDDEVSDWDSAQSYSEYNDDLRSLYDDIKSMPTTKAELLSGFCRVKNEVIEYNGGKTQFRNIPDIIAHIVDEYSSHSKVKELINAIHVTYQGTLTR